MKATDLIGKKAIRTKPAHISERCNDRSYMDAPIFIVKATDSHIVYTYPEENFFSKIISDKSTRILPFEWCDDNWIDYDELVSGVMGVRA